MGLEGGSHAVYGRKVSTVVPRSVTGEAVVCELGGVDLVMKLHYLRSVYYFESNGTIDGLTIQALKEPMFQWLDVYHPVSGRIRRTEAGRPFVKCNDCGVRIVEAMCGQTLDEWLLAVKDSSRWRQLAPDNVLGPDLYFSPFIFLQFTRFKCGGMAVGLSWPHVLGDAITAANFINLWAQLLSGSPPKCQHLHDPETKTEKALTKFPDSVELLSVKQVEPVEDSWLSLNNGKMATQTFQITEAKIKQIQAKESSQVSSFEIISALFWQSLAKTRKDREPQLVTICRNNTSAKRRGLLSNEQKISRVVSESPPSNATISELAAMIAKQEVDETEMIEDLVDRESGKPDFIVYGANLTFIDMESIPFYEMELKGQKPIHVDCSIDGIGDEGAVLVLQGPQKTHGSGANRGKMVMLILPEDQIPPLQEVLESAWGIA